MKFCMNCMAQYDDSLKICPECSFKEGTMPVNSRCMEPGLVLADRYIVGMPLNIDGWFVKYIGWDALLSKKVTVYEYSPVRFASRNIGDTKITPIKEKEFYKYMEIFQRKALLLAEQHLPDNICSVYESFEKNGTAYVVTEYVKGKPLPEYMADEGAIPPQTVEKMFLPILRSLDKLHDSGFVIGGFSAFDMLVLGDGTLFLNSYLENILFNVTDDQSDINQKEKQKYFPPERLSSDDQPGLSPSNDVFSAAMIMYAMMGVKLPEYSERAAYYAKNKNDKLKPLGAYRVKVDKSKENALRNASFFDSTARTPDTETFIKELSGDKKTALRVRGGGLPGWVKVAVPIICALIIAGGVIIALTLKNDGKPPKDTPAGSSQQEPAPDGRNIVISPEEKKLRPGDEFTLIIRCTGIEDLRTVEYDISQPGIIEEKYINTKTLDMTFKALKPGAVTVTISCGDIRRECRVEVGE